MLVKSETIDVEPVGEPKSLRPIDPQHDLMSPCPRRPARSSSTTIGRWRWTATRYQLEEIKRSSIELALVRMVVTPAETISVQALYRIRTARQRIETICPKDAAFDSQPLRVNGRPADLGIGWAKQVFRSAARPPIPTCRGSSSSLHVARQRQPPDAGVSRGAGDRSRSTLASICPRR